MLICCTVVVTSDGGIRPEICCIASIAIARVMKLGGMQLSRNAVLEWRNRECGRSMDQSDGTEVPVTKVQDSRNLPPPSLYAGALALSTGSAGHIANLSGSVQETSLLALEQATVIAAAAAHASLQCGKQFKWWQPDT